MVGKIVIQTIFRLFQENNPNLYPIILQNMEYKINEKEDDLLDSKHQKNDEKLDAIHPHLYQDDILHSLDF